MGRRKATPRTYHCVSCGQRHSKPTGKRCLFTQHSDSENEIDVHDPEDNTVALSPPADQATGATPTALTPPSDPLPGQVAALTDIVSRLVQKMDQMEGRNGGSFATADSCPARSNRDTQVTTPVTSHTAHPTLQDLRRMDPLNARVDALMASAPDTQPDVLAMRSSNAPVVGATDTMMTSDIALLGKTSKSPRDVVVRKIKHPVLWPHHFVHRPGGAEIHYDTLSLPDFVAGVAAILLLPELPSRERQERTSHLRAVMHLAKIYTWPSVRTVYGALLEDIQYGDRNWGDRDALSALKEEMLTPRDLLGTAGSTSSHGQDGDRLATVCRQFNYNPTGCTRQQCRLLHVCMPCLRYRDAHRQHKALECPHKPAPGSKNGAAGPQ